MKKIISNSGFVSISEFSRGNTARIFNELKELKEITVMKNNRPIGILSLPKEKTVDRQSAGQDKATPA